MDAASQRLLVCQPQAEYAHKDSARPAATTPDLVTSSAPQVLSVSQLSVDNPSTPAPQSERWAQGRPSHNILLPSPLPLPTPHHIDSPLKHSPNAAHSTHKPFKCPHCTRGYADISTLRWHMTKVHHLRMRTVLFDRARHAVQGMPTCSLCHAKFTRWETLEAHIHNQRCTQELPTIPTEAKGPVVGSEPSTEVGPLRPAASSVASCVEPVDSSVLPDTGHCRDEVACLFGPVPLTQVRDLAELLMANWTRMTPRCAPLRPLQSLMLLIPVTPLKRNVVHSLRTPLTLRLHAHPTSSSTAVSLSYGTGVCGNC